MALERPRPMDVETFVAWAMRQPEGKRYELVRGEVVAQASERNRHNIVKQEAWLALRTALRAAGLDCTVLGDGATVAIDETTAYEPDVTVQCGAPVDPDSVFADRPTIVVEVLSPSTAGVDAGAKLSDYFLVPSLAHYLMIDPDRRLVIHHARGEADEIRTRVAREGVLRLDPPGVEVAVAAMVGAG